MMPVMFMGFSEKISNISLIWVCIMMTQVIGQTQNMYFFMYVIMQDILNITLYEVLYTYIYIYI